MDLARILQLREESAQLREQLRVSGRYALSKQAKAAAFGRVHEIDTEIKAIENPPVEIVNPLDAMTLDELRALYAERFEQITGYKQGEKRDPSRPIGRIDSRISAQMMAIDTRIQTLEAEAAGE